MVDSTFSDHQKKIGGASEKCVGQALGVSSLKSVLLNSDNESKHTREFEFNDADFLRVRKMIHNVAGITLPDTKENMVYSRLARRVRLAGLKKFSDYLDKLDRSLSDPEWEHFTNALTTNLTSFYREAHHFEMLAKQLRAMQGQGTINIWCCAASTGEEPYTLAITAMEALGTPTPPVKIVATDIDTDVLKKAQNGVYRVDQTDKVPSDILRRYFTKGSNDQLGVIAVKPEVKNLVTFKKLNLLGPHWEVTSGIDVIFCRNVMIYFSKEDQLKVLKRFVPVMNPNGLLYAGHSENFMFARDLFKLKSRTVYEVISQKSRN